jgi:hypothetical protein
MGPPPRGSPREERYHEVLLEDSSPRNAPGTRRRARVRARDASCRRVLRTR